MKKIKSLCLVVACMLFVQFASAQSEATFYTSMGSFKIELTDTLTPITVDSFIARVSEKFYDGLIFHRVIDNFMIQGGDPLGNGTGGPGYSFKDEFAPSLKNIPGALAMANSGVNTNGSQFFINLVANSHLNNKHTVFGMVTDGFSVVQAIGKVPTAGNPSNKPITDVTMDSIRITRFASSVANVAADYNFKVYPNPTTGVFNIDVLNEATEIMLTDITGKVLHHTTAKNIAVYNVDISGQPKGLYNLRLRNSKGTTFKKILVY